MITHILLPTDGSDLAYKAVLHGVRLARAFHARVTAVTVIEPPGYLVVEPKLTTEIPPIYEKRARAMATRALDQARIAGEAVGIDVATLIEVSDQPYRAIVDCAAANHCDLIVMASHGRRGPAALVLGGETTKVLTHCAIPVLVYR